MRKILFGQRLHLALLTLPSILVSLISVKWRIVYIFSALKQSGLLLPCVFCHLHTQWVFKPYWFSLIVKIRGPRDAGITLSVSWMLLTEFISFPIIQKLTALSCFPRESWSESSTVCVAFKCHEKSSVTSLCTCKKITIKTTTKWFKMSTGMVFLNGCYIILFSNFILLSPHIRAVPRSH